MRRNLVSDVVGLRYVIAPVGSGWVGIVASARGLQRLTLPQPSIAAVNEILSDSLSFAIHAPGWFADLLRRLNLYFSGHRVDFTDELDLSSATLFQRQVWEQTRLIPYGETRSYRWVAEQIAQPASARAVGQALGQNPLSIIVPCHRVIASDGKLCGFAGGLDMKRELLRLEKSAAG